MSQAPIRAACTCGGVTLELLPPSRFVCHCHCGNCRRAHGAGFVTWAGFPDGQMTVTRGADVLAHYRTDTGATRSFCRNCGTPMLYASPRWPGEVHVAVGCFLDPPDALPSGHVYADRAPAWCPVTDGLPRRGGATGTEPLP